jgi:hypothetical protein
MHRVITILHNREPGSGCQDADLLQKSEVAKSINASLLLSGDAEA